MRIDRELVERVEWSAASLCIRQTHAISLHPSGTHAHARSLDRGALVSFGPGSFVNRGIGLGLGGTPPAELVHEIVGFYDRLGLEPALEVGAWVNGDLLDELARVGFVTTEFRSVFVRGLGDQPEVAPVHVEAVDQATIEARKAIVAHPAQPGTGLTVRCCQPASFPPPCARTGLRSGWARNCMRFSIRSVGARPSMWSW